MADTIRRFTGKPYLMSGILALGGMIVGAVVGIAVQVGLQSAGILGPSVESLLAEQQSNFDDVRSRLDNLQNLTDDPDLSVELTELAKLVHRQDELRQQATTELMFLGGQVESLKDRALDEKGYAGGADFWLKIGESVSVGDDRHVIGLIRGWGTAADVVLNGNKARLTVGGFVETDSCKVFLKQAVPRDDGRLGFDLSCN